MNDKELLKKLGQETIYSAKGHFKAADIRRNLITAAIWICILTSILDIMNIVPNDIWFDAIGLFGALALLTWNEGNGKEYRSKHKEAAENYLALHKEIRSCFFLEKFSQEQIEQLNVKVTKLDQSQKPDIPGFARRWAKNSIEKSDPETDNWFLN